MKTVEVTLKVSESILNVLNQDREQFGKQLLLTLALHLFKEHKLSLGKAAELAEMSRREFMTELVKYDIPVIDYDPADLKRELESFES